MTKSDSGAERAARRIAESFPNITVHPDWIAHMAAIIREETGTQWISVSTRLPDDGMEVLGFLGFKNTRLTGFCMLVEHHVDGWYGDDEEKLSLAVTHWQPLPAAPDEGGTRNGNV